MSYILDACPHTHTTLYIHTIIYAHTYLERVTVATGGVEAGVEGATQVIDLGGVFLASNFFGGVLRESRPADALFHCTCPGLCVVSCL